METPVEGGLNSWGPGLPSFSAQTLGKAAHGSESRNARFHAGSVCEKQSQGREGATCGQGRVRGKAGRRRQRRPTLRAVLTAGAI